MKISNWMIIFMSIFVACMCAYEYKSVLLESQERENIRIEQNALSAAESSMQGAGLGEEEVFGNDKVRENVVNTFYHVYAENNNYTGEKEEWTKYDVPVILMVDWNGFYIKYIDTVLDNGITTYADAITERQVWVKNYGTYTIEYRLDDIIEVSDGAQFIRKGNYSEISDEFVAQMGDVPTELAFLTSYEGFVEERNSVIIDTVNSSLSYYVKTYNPNNLNEINYSIKLPQKEGQKSGVLDRPSLIAMCQGKQKVLFARQYNVFTLVGVEEVVSRRYYISRDSDGVLLYHRKDCTELTEVIGSGTMEECAKKGANPDDCVLQ